MDLNSTGGLIFISCGQVTEQERKLGDDVSALVRELTPHEPYFADKQSSLEGLTKNILGSLDRAIGLITIMHPRGTVTFNDAAGSHEQVRASVWIEQEIAIAAYITEVLKQPISVAAFVHADIYREGMRDQLLLNPVSFTQDSEVLAQVRQVLLRWRDISPRVAESELDRVKVGVTISFLSKVTMLLAINNYSDTEVVVRSVELKSEGIRLNGLLTPRTYNEWTFASHRESPLSVTFHSNPIAALIKLNRDKGVVFDADLEVGLGCDIRGRFKQFLEKHRVHINGSDQNIHVLSGQ
jgi:hypothetical protein